MQENNNANHSEESMEVKMHKIKKNSSGSKRLELLSKAIITLGAIGLLSLGCSSAESSGESPDESQAVAQQPSIRVVNIEATKVSLTDFVDYIRVTGEVQAQHDVIVSSEESGVIKQFYVAKGAFVKKGDKIAKLKDEVLVTQVAEAQAAATLAREQFKRQKTLWQKEKVGSELAYLQAKSQSDASTARLNMLKSRLANTTVRSPISGIYESQFLEVGEMASPSKPLVRVINTDMVKISGGVAERYALSVARGDSAFVTFDIMPDVVFNGIINYVGAAVDRDNRTFGFEIVLANEGRLIKPNMVANVRLVREQRTDVITVPRQIVKRTEFGHQLYVAQEFQGNMVAAARWIELGPAHKNRIIVERGLAAGELLITLGHDQVDHGTPIRVTNAGDLVVAEEND